MAGQSFIFHGTRDFTVRVRMRLGVWGLSRAWGFGTPFAVSWVMVRD